MKKTKRCSDCKMEKPITEFYKIKHRKIGLSSWCKSCYSKWHKIYSKRYRDSGKANTTRNKWNDNNRDKYNFALLKSHLKRHYGLTIRQFNRLLEAQNKVCAICNQPETAKNRKYLSVDHDHKTGKVRGLLCIRCNAMIGNAGDNPAILGAAIGYLKRGKLPKNIA